VQEESKGETKKMHLRKVEIVHKRFPTRDFYPFNLEILNKTGSIEFDKPATFFVGENGTGKSTVLRAICRKCGIYIWQENDRTRYVNNPYEENLYQALDIDWADGPVPGSFFGSQNFQHFIAILDEWAATDPGQLNYFGGESLMTKSHGQSLMSYFRSRYKIKGIYFLDEPETALSPKSQIGLLRLIKEMGEAGHAQFVIATHSPILMSCPGADIFSFDAVPIRKVAYEETSHYRIYRDFMNDFHKYL
jgi:predicted ATPase